MRGTEGLADLARDLVRAGPRFALDALRANRRFAGKGAAWRRIATPSGIRIDVRPGTSDLAVVRQVFRDGEYNLAALGPVFARLRKTAAQFVAAGEEPVIVDAGANIGTASLVFRDLFPEAVVLAVEPNPATLPTLHRNVGSDPSVRICAAAIGSDEGFVALDNEETAWATTTRPADSGVPMRTISGLLAEVERGRLLIVKVDIEGFEDALFARNTGWLDDLPCLIVEPHDWMFPGKRKSASLLREAGARFTEVHISGENLVFARPVRGNEGASVEAV